MDASCNLPRTPVWRASIMHLCHLCALWMPHATFLTPPSHVACTRQPTTSVFSARCGCLMQPSFHPLCHVHPSTPNVSHADALHFDPQRRPQHPLAQRVAQPQVLRVRVYLKGQYVCTHMVNTCVLNRSIRVYSKGQYVCTQYVCTQYVCAQYMCTQ